MNKLEKIQNVPGEVVEKEIKEQEEGNEEVAEDSGKNFFSFFSFWKKMNNEAEEETVYEDSEEKNDKKPFALKFLNKKTTVLAACVMVIAIAGYLNIRYSDPSKNLPDNIVSDNAGEMSLNTEPETEHEEVVFEDTQDDYFALAVINRERVRDEAIEMLKDVAGSDATDVSAKNDAYAEMTRMANEIANEANIESLVKAKGFRECVAVISNDSANIIVESDGLTINEVAQIKEIVYLECGVLPDNIKIIEKTGV